MEKNQETKENLRKPMEKLGEFIQKHRFTTSLMGRVLNLHTYIFSKIWHIAWLLNTKSEDFKRFRGRIDRYLQPRKGEDIRTLAAKPKKKGGLGLIDVEARVNTIKSQQILQILEQLPETDNILYNISTNQQKIFGKISKGPTAQILNKQYHDITKNIENNINKIQTYHQNTKHPQTKHIQEILYPTSHNYIRKEIFETQEPKLLSLNFLCATGTLDLRQGSVCPFCKRDGEDLEHYLLRCTYLEGLREDTKNILRKTTVGLDKKAVVEMEGVPKGWPNQVVSLYKFNIWKFREKARYGQRVSEEQVRRSFDLDLRFYAHHISQEIID